MIRTLRALFLRCLLREKLLLLAFILIGVVLWLSGFSSRAAKFWREKTTTTKTLDEQTRWLANSAAIDAATQKSAAQLDATKTYSENRLVTTVQQLANESGLRAFQSNGAPTTTKSSGRISIHTLNFTISRITQADWRALLNFYQALQDRSPYIGIDKFALGINGAQHTLSMTVSSIEVAP